MPSGKRGIALLGSTGSIGTQTLEVISAFPELFDLQVITAGSNANLLIEQAIKYHPNMVVIADEFVYKQVKEALANEDIHVYCGEAALCEVVQSTDVDVVLTALVGYAGLKPTIAAIKAKKDIALANKETLVVAGQLISALAQAHGVQIYPVDSEHSAIFQCLPGEHMNAIEKIYLTASGGPFRGFTQAQLEQVTKAQALKHPNWSMGAKITIDSATMMNKGLEVIEARWLFDLTAEQIDVVVHPQSIVHSLVQFEDGSMKAQMGLPDMKLPIQYALTYPYRLKTNYPRFDFMNYPQLTFEKPDRVTFKNLDLAYQALALSGNIPCALNAANEITVQAFLEDRISFLDIARINEVVMQAIPTVTEPNLDDYIATDLESRARATELVSN
ncbi:MAG: 1-deoxy-D-xylulose-5-phosphate reductoisomerase [Flavobacteriia bacterium]|nr:1-deoxy-D-xylulose-5-phosphate reductoisomerase [Flavobacteriia bacterium]